MILNICTIVQYQHMLLMLLIMMTRCNTYLDEWTCSDSLTYIDNTSGNFECIFEMYSFFQIFIYS
jgi:hypothetical protein